VVLAVIVAGVVVRGNPFTKRGSQPSHPDVHPIQVTGVHFVNASDGWAVGSRPCTNGPCPAVLERTTDGGQTWTQLAVPRGAIGAPDLNCANDARCVTDVGFAPDGRHGYLSATPIGSALYATSDGGRTWTSLTSRKQNGQLVVSANTAVCLVSPPTSGDRLFVAPLGSSQWHDVTPWNFPAIDVTLAAAGSSMYAFVVGAQYAWLYRSSDGGSSWSHISSQYLQHTPKTYDLGPLASWTFAVAPDGAVVVARFIDGRTPTLRVSTDGGATFGPEHDLAVPSGVRPAALSGTTLAAASATDLLETAHAHGTAVYFVSSDGGASWLRTSQGPVQVGLPDTRWSFPAHDFGVRIADNGKGIDVTTDQGRTQTTRSVG
jgi:photosystem II stability/assembly factor-like uncharacterized protein